MLDSASPPSSDKLSPNNQPLMRQQSPSRQLEWKIILQTPGADSPTKMFPLVLLHSSEWC